MRRFVKIFVDNGGGYVYNQLKLKNKPVRKSSNISASLFQRAAVGGMRY